MAYGLRKQAFVADSYNYWTDQYSVVNVKDYGAVGDGMHDDTAAIQAAIDTAEASGGGIVFIPAGTYIVSSTLVVDRSRVHIVGAGMGATTLKASAFVTGTILRFTGLSTTSRNFYSLIQNLGIDGNNCSGALGLHLKWTSLFRLINVFITNCPAGGLKIEEVWDSTFWGFLITYCGTNGGNAALTILNTNTDNSNMLRFYDGQLEHSQGYGIEINGQYTKASIFNISFVNVKMEKGNGPGLRAVNILGYVEDLYFDKCKVVNYYAGYGFYIDALVGSYTTIRECDFRNSTVGGTAINITNVGCRTNIVDNLFYNWNTDIAFPSQYTKDVFMHGNRRKSPDARPYVAIDGTPVFQKQFQYFGTSTPTVGTWSRGDIIWNISPAAGGYIGWVCVAAGTPGTWKPFGAISA